MSHRKLGPNHRETRFAPRRGVAFRLAFAFVVAGASTLEAQTELLSPTPGPQTIHSDSQPLPIEYPFESLAQMRARAAKKLVGLLGLTPHASLPAMRAVPNASSLQQSPAPLLTQVVPAGATELSSGRGANPLEEGPCLDRLPALPETLPASNTPSCPTPPLPLPPLSGESLTSRQPELLSIAKSLKLAVEPKAPLSAVYEQLAIEQGSLSSAIESIAEANHQAGPEGFSLSDDQPADSVSLTLSDQAPSEGEGFSLSDIEADDDSAFSLSDQTGAVDARLSLVDTDPQQQSEFSLSDELAVENAGFSLNDKTPERELRYSLHDVDSEDTLFSLSDNAGSEQTQHAAVGNAAAESAEFSLSDPSVVDEAGLSFSQTVMGNQSSDRSEDPTSPPVQRDSQSNRPQNSATVATDMQPSSRTPALHRSSSRDLAQAVALTPSGKPANASAPKALQVQIEGEPNVSALPAAASLPTAQTALRLAEPMEIAPIQELAIPNHDATRNAISQAAADTSVTAIEAVAIEIPASDVAGTPAVPSTNLAATESKQEFRPAVPLRLVTAEPLAPTMKPASPLAEPPSGFPVGKIVDGPEMVIGVEDASSIGTETAIIEMTVEYPNICRLIQTAQAKVSVVGLRIGTTRIALVTQRANGDRIVEVRQVRVAQEQRVQQSRLLEIAQEINRTCSQLYPGSNVEVIAANDELVVQGVAISEAEAKKILRFIRKTSLAPVVDRLRSPQD